MNGLSDIFFSKKKERTLDNSVDLSRKGNIDEAVQDLITFINNIEEYITTSSCSGRIIVVSKDGGDNCKKGCKWILTSHSVVDVEDALDKIKCEERNMTLKFEPFILHIQCQDVAAAKRMQNCALAAGFKNSGSVFGRNGALTLAVRGAHGLEVPLSDDHGLIVTDQYVRYVINKANKKMIENEKKIEGFTNAVYKLKSCDTSDESRHTTMSDVTQDPVT